MKKRLKVLFLCALLFVMAIVAIALSSCDYKSPHELEIEKELESAQNPNASIGEREPAFRIIKGDRPDILHRYVLDMNESPELRWEVIYYISNEDVLIQVLSNVFEYPSLRKAAFKSIEYVNRSAWITWIIYGEDEPLEMRVWAVKKSSFQDELASLALDKSEPDEIRIAALENKSTTPSHLDRYIVKEVVLNESKSLMLRAVFLRSSWFSDLILEDFIFDPGMPELLRGIAITKLSPRWCENLLAEIACDDSLPAHLRALAISRFASHHPEKGERNITYVYP